MALFKKKKKPRKDVTIKGVTARVGSRSTEKKL